MKEKDIDFNNYNKILFIDASGDDGFNFSDIKGQGSSNLFIVSCFVTTPSDIDYNTEILNEAKHQLNLDGKELKSTTLRRHRFSNDAYDKLKNLRGTAFSMIAFKKQLINNKVPELAAYANNTKKKLSGEIHSFPFYALTKLEQISKSDNVLIVIDCMKKSEMAEVDKRLELYQKMSRINVTTVYRDSKSSRYELIQIADVISGTMREYFEQHTQFDGYNYFCNKCYYLNNYCNRKKGVKALLKNVKIEDKYKYIFKLHSQPEKPQITAIHIFSIPSKYMDYYSYITCKTIGYNNIKKRS